MTEDIKDILVDFALHLQGKVIQAIINEIPFTSTVTIVEEYLKERKVQK
jgi:hypothetical protein